MEWRHESEYGHLVRPHIHTNSHRLYNRLRRRLHVKEVRDVGRNENAILRSERAAPLQPYNPLHDAQLPQT